MNIAILSNSLELLASRLQERVLSANYPLIIATSRQAKSHLERRLGCSVQLLEGELPEGKELHIVSTARFDPSWCGRAQVYLLSPCMHFWSDALSDRERARLHARLEQDGAPSRLHEALDQWNDSNSLLANHGRVGREMARRLEASGCAVEEAYLLPCGVCEEPAYSSLIRQEICGCRAGPLTLLGALQADLLLLVGPQEPRPAVEADGSLQLHACRSLLREVELLHEAVQGYKALVLVSDLERYRPYIERVFGSEDYQIVEPQRSRHGLFRLLDWPARRCSKEALLELDILEDATRAFVRQSSFEWGYDAAHRQALLADEGLDVRAAGERGTWQQVEEGAWEVTDLFEQARELHGRKPLRQWMDHFRALLAAWFAADEEAMRLGQAMATADETEASRAEAIAWLQTVLREHVPWSADLLIGTARSLAGLQAPIVAWLGAEAAVESYDWLLALVGAQERLHVSFQGYSWEEREEIEPAAPVRDLLAYCRRHYGVELLQEHAQHAPRTYTGAAPAVRCEPVRPPLDEGDLRRVARAPLALYYRSYGLRLFSPDDEGVTLRALQARRIREALVRGDPDALRPLQEHGKLTPCLQELYGRYFAAEQQRLQATQPPDDALLVLEKRSLPALIRCYPDALLLRRPSVQLHFVQDGVTKELAIDPGALELYREYAAFCQQAPCCGYPDWIAGLCAGKGAEELVAAHQQRMAFAGFADPYLELWLRRGAEGLEETRQWVRRVYASLL